MALKFDDECSKTVEEVRSDKFELNWVAFKYEGKNKILVGGKGTGGSVCLWIILHFLYACRFPFHFIRLLPPCVCFRCF